MNEDLILKYTGRLDAALGDKKAFEALFESLKEDRDVGQAEAVAIASRFVATTAASTSRSKALDKIWRRHSAFVTFQLKQRAMAGRSAA